MNTHEQQNNRKAWKVWNGMARANARHVPFQIKLESGMNPITENKERSPYSHSRFRQNQDEIPGGCSKCAESLRK